MSEKWSEKIMDFLTVTLGIGIVLIAWYALSKTAGRLYYLFWDAVYLLIIPAWAVSRWMHKQSVGYVPSADPALVIWHPSDLFEMVFTVPIVLATIGWFFGSWIEDRKRGFDMMMVALPLTLLPLYMWIWGVATTYPGGGIMYKFEQFSESCPTQRSAISQCTYTPKAGGKFL